MRESHNFSGDVDEEVGSTEMGKNIMTASSLIGLRIDGQRSHVTYHITFYQFSYDFQKQVNWCIAGIRGIKMWYIKMSFSGDASWYKKKYMTDSILSIYV